MHCRHSPGLINQAKAWKVRQPPSEMVGKWLSENMLVGNVDPNAKANEILGFLANHSTTATHARHLPPSKCREIGLKVEMLEDDKALQDLVLTIHHAYMHTFSMASAVKITENHLGVATILTSANPSIHGRSGGSAN